MKHKTFLQALTEMDIDFEAPAAGSDETGEMHAEEDDMNDTVTMDSELFTHLLTSASEMSEEELTTVAAEIIEKGKDGETLTMDDFPHEDDPVGDPDGDPEAEMDDEEDIRMVKPRTEEECEMSGY